MLFVNKVTYLIGHIARDVTATKGVVHCIEGRVVNLIKDFDWDVVRLFLRVIKLCFAFKRHNKVG